MLCLSFDCFIWKAENVDDRGVEIPRSDDRSRRTYYSGGHSEETAYSERTVTIGYRDRDVRSHHDQQFDSFRKNEYDSANYDERDDRFGDYEDPRNTGYHSSSSRPHEEPIREERVVRLRR